MITNYENIDKKKCNLELDKIYPKVMVQLKQIIRRNRVSYIGTARGR